MLVGAGGGVGEAKGEMRMMTMSAWSFVTSLFVERSLFSSLSVCPLPWVPWWMDIGRESDDVRLVRTQSPFLVTVVFLRSLSPLPLIR